MSLSDHLRYLRALNGGPSNADLEAWAKRAGCILHRAAIAMSAQMNSFESRRTTYRRGMQWHRPPRKALALHVHAAIQNHEVVALRLRDGELIGHLVGFGRGRLARSAKKTLSSSTPCGD
jgi:hypothetical protein